jgi:hypothetical protein
MQSLTKSDTICLPEAELETWQTEDKLTKFVPVTLLISLLTVVLKPILKTNTKRYEFILRSCVLRWSQLIRTALNYQNTTVSSSLMYEKSGNFLTDAYY